MQKILVYLLLFISFKAAIAQTVHHQTSIYFEKDKSELTLEAQNTLTSRLQSILDLETYSVKIEAHTDDDGSLTYNQLLSEKRANAVYEFLLLQRLNTQDLQIVAKGETNPAFNNQTKTGQQQNRRVDVFFVSKSKELEAKNTIEPKVERTRTSEKVENFEDLKRLTTTNTLQSFPVNTEKEQKIEGRKGTKLTIPANAFVLEDGGELPPDAKVDIELQEALDLEDMLLNNLSTKSGDTFLETGGMVKIEANYQGKSLQLKPDKNIEVKVPKNGISAEKQKDMELFYGVSQENENTAMDWKPTNKTVETTPPHPKVEIDLTDLENFDIDEIQKWKDAELANLPLKIKAPKKPKKPSFPKKPNKYQHQFKPTGSEKEKYTQEKINKQSEKLYSQALIEYEKEKGAYEVQEKQYQLNTLNFKKELKGYQKASEERKKLVYKHIQRVSIMQKIENQYGYTWSIMPEFKKEVFKNGLTSKSPSIVYKELMNRNRANFEFEIEYVAKELGLSKPEVAYHWSRVKYNRYLFNELREEYKDSYAITEIEELLENLDAKYYQKKEEMGIITSEDYDYFTTSVNQMSWINIDRWLKEKPIQKIFVEAEPNKNTRYFAVSHTFNSCLAVGQNLDSKKSPSIQLPIGEKFTLVGIKIENNQIWMGSENIEVGKGGNKVPLNFQEKSLTEFKDSFRELEKQRTI